MKKGKQMEIDFEFTTVSGNKFKVYGMFTDRGNALVSDLVVFAKNHNLSYDAVEAIIKAVSKDELFEEITDTAVREEIFTELGFYE